MQFTVEEPDHDGYLCYLDTKVTPGPNNTHLHKLQKANTNRPISILGQ